MRFVFGSHELDADQLELRRAGERVGLEPQAFDVLLYLVRHRERVVPKEELMDEVWGGRFVSETAVTSRIKQVRRALGDDGAAQTLVRTYHGRGYRFVEEASEVPAATTPELQRQQAPRVSPLLALASDAGAVTWQVLGQGPPDLLVLPGTAPLDLAGPHPLVTGLSAISRVVQFAPEGTASDLVALSLAVLDAAASERAVVMAEGARWERAVALAGAAPGRVGGLVLFGAAEVPDDVARRTRAIAAPALVLHRIADPVAPISGGRLLASALPHGEFRALGGDGHAAADDVPQLCEAVTEFVETAAVEQAASRTLTALVGLAGGDVSALASVLVDLGGTERRGPEGSVVVSFDGPANAFRALGSRRARGLVDEVGVGVAIDEVSRSSYLVSGHGVDVARLFALHAGPGEVLLPNVIKDLLAGSGLAVRTLEPVDLPYVGPHPVHRWLRH